MANNNTSKKNNMYRYDFSEINDVGALEDLLAESNSIKGAREAMARHTVSWPFEHLDCRNAADYRKLKLRSDNGKPSEWDQVKEKFLEAVQSFLGVEAAAG